MLILLNCVLWNLFFVSFHFYHFDIYLKIRKTQTAMVKSNIKNKIPTLPVCQQIQEVYDVDELLIQIPLPPSLPRPN